jgi:hypothetical protein
VWRNMASSLTHADKITWPLCFVEPSLLAFDLDGEIGFVVTNIRLCILMRVAVRQGKIGSAWLTFAVALLCLQSSSVSRGSGRGPFDTIPTFDQPACIRVILWSLPGECVTIADAFLQRMRSNR